MLQTPSLSFLQQRVQQLEKDNKELAEAKAALEDKVKKLQDDLQFINKTWQQREDEVVKERTKALEKKCARYVDLCDKKTIDVARLEVENEDLKRKLMGPRKGQ